jgi:hypothetical protein
MRVKIHDIEWDTDGKSAKRLGLPSEIILEGVTQELLDEDGDGDLADLISDQYGFCTKTFFYTVLN